MLGVADALGQVGPGGVIGGSMWGSASDNDRVYVSINKFNDSKRRIVAKAKARLKHAGVAAITCFIAWAQHVKELANKLNVFDLRNGLTPRM